MRDLKQERKDRVKEIRENNRNSLLKQQPDSNNNMFLINKDKALHTVSENLKNIYKNNVDKDTQINLEENLMRKLPEFGFWYASKEKGKETGELFRMSYKENYLNTPYAKEQTIYSDYREVESDKLREHLKEKIVKSFGTNGLYNIKGIHFNADSELSKKAAADKALTKFIRENSYKIRNNMKINDPTIKFQGINMYNAIGHADIQNIKIFDNGDLFLQIVDIYDFDNNPESSTEILAARRLQDTNDIIPYFEIIDIIIPREIAKDLLY